MRHIKTILTIGLSSILTYASIIAQPYTGSLKCKVTGNGYSDETIIAFVPGATSGFDALYDSWKLFSINPNVPSIYTTISGGHLSINSSGSLTGEWEEDLFIRIPDSGMYQLQFSTLYPFDTAVRFSIFDSLNNSTIGNITTSTYQIYISNTSTLPNSVFKVKLKVHLPTQIDTILQPSCLDSLATVSISRPGDSNYTCCILNASMDTVGFYQVNTPQTDLSGISPGIHYIVTMLEGNQQSTVQVAIQEKILTIAEVELTNDSLLLSDNPVLEGKDMSTNNHWAYWDFDDGSTPEYGENVTHTYHEPGNYELTFVAGNDFCSDTVVRNVVVYEDLPNGLAAELNKHLNTYFSNGTLHIRSDTDLNVPYSIQVYAQSGQMLFSEKGFFAGKQREIAFNPGIRGYLVGVLQTEDEQYLLRFSAH